MYDVVPQYTASCYPFVPWTGFRESIYFILQFYLSEFLKIVLENDIFLYYLGVEVQI